MQCVICVEKADHLNVIWLYFRSERLQIVKNFEFKLNACNFLYQLLGRLKVTKYVAFHFSYRAMQQPRLSRL